MTRDEMLAIAKPILFNTEMVRAILDGSKTATRRLIRPQPVLSGEMWQWKDCQWMDQSLGFPSSGIDDYAPFKPGDILYVRETWHEHPTQCGKYYFRSSSLCSGKSVEGDCPEPFDYNENCDLCEWYDGWIKWRPSIHMPKEAARLFLRVTGVRAERLQNITEEQALSEGIQTLTKDGEVNKYAVSNDRWVVYCQKHMMDDTWWQNLPESPIKVFHHLFDSTIPKTNLLLYGWEANPWVWVIEFEAIEICAFQKTDSGGIA